MFCPTPTFELNVFSGLEYDLPLCSIQLVPYSQRREYLISPRSSPNDACFLRRCLSGTKTCCNCAHRKLGRGSSTFADLTNESAHCGDGHEVVSLSSRLGRLSGILQSGGCESSRCLSRSPRILTGLATWHRKRYLCRKRRRRRPGPALWLLPRSSRSLSVLLSISPYPSF